MTPFSGPESPKSLDEPLLRSHLGTLSFKNENRPLAHDKAFYQSPGLLGIIERGVP